MISKQGKVINYYTSLLMTQRQFYIITINETFFNPFLLLQAHYNLIGHLGKHKDTLAY